MNNLGAWSFLWENPERYIIVKNSRVYPSGDLGLIFEKTTRYYIGVEDDNLLRLLIQMMLQAGVQSVESHDFQPEPTDAVKIIENGLASGLSREEINRRLRMLEKQHLGRGG